MPSDNSLNPGKGRKFQEQATKLLSRHFNIEFHSDYSIPIGSPPKNHKFDLVSVDQRFVGECKNYSWTEAGNVPSAKIGFVNEAAFYLLFLPPETVRFIAMRRDTHPKRRETLSEYYYRTNHHLLRGLKILEVDLNSGLVKEMT